MDSDKQHALAHELVGDWLNSYESAQQLLHRLDEALNPWDDPGVVPTEPGRHWGANHLGQSPQPCIVHADGDWTWLGAWVTGCDMRNMAKKFGWQFRRRWTPMLPGGE